MASSSRREKAGSHDPASREEPRPTDTVGRSRRPTGRDVARLAGVSQASVSLVFTGNAGKRVSEATEKRIRAAADMLGYHPQATARQLRLGRTGLILLAIPNMRGPFFCRVLEGAQEKADSFGLTVVLGSGWGYPKLLRMCAANQFDGLVVCSPNDRLLGELPDCLPTVFLDADPRLAGERRGVIELDVAGGMRSAVRHLVELGHRHIGRLRYHRAAYTFRARQAAFEEAVGRRAGLDVVEAVVPADAGVDGVRAAARQLLGAAAPPRAVVCDDDVAATAVYQVAAERRLRIPEDVSVVGMDNTDTAELCAPPLTTVDLDGERLGRLGVTTLARMLRGEPVDPVPPVRTRLVTRDSTRRAERVGR